MSKSHVGIEQHHCPICGENKDTGAILLDRRMRESLEHHTVTGMSVCKECNEQSEKGFIALIGADPEKSKPLPNGNLNPEDAYRTAEYLWLHRSVAAQIFNVELGDHPFVYIEPEAIEKVKEIVDAHT